MSKHWLIWPCCTAQRRYLSPSRESPWSLLDRSHVLQDILFTFVCWLLYMTRRTTVLRPVRQDKSSSSPQWGLWSFRTPKQIPARSYLCCSLWAWISRQSWSSLWRLLQAVKPQRLRFRNSGGVAHVRWGCEDAAAEASYGPDGICDGFLEGNIFRMTQMWRIPDPN